MGYAEDELLAFTPEQVQQLIHPEDRNRVGKYYRARIAGKPAPQRYEFRTIRKDGSVRWVEAFASRIEYQGKPASQLAMIDITERKQVALELQESEERFKILADHAPFGISIMTPDRSFKYLNPRFTEIFGYNIEDIPDKDTWFKKAYPDEAYRRELISIWKRDTAEALKIGTENPRVFTVSCKDGQDKIINFRRIDLKDGKQYQI